MKDKEYFDYRDYKENTFPSTYHNTNPSNVNNYDHISNNNQSHVSYQNTQDFYDIQAEEGSLMVIKTQNKKIKDLLEEVNYKEMSINKLKNQLDFYTKSTSDYESNKNKYSEHSKILKEQIALLQNQVQSLEYSDKTKDKINTENIEKFQIREEDLLLEIKDKENTISRTKLQLETTENHLRESMMKIKSLEKILKDKEKKINEVEEVLKEKDLIILRKEQDYNESLKNINEIKFSFNNEKEAMDLKVKQLVEVVQKQAYELQNFSDNHKKSDIENKTLKSQNTKLKREVDSLVVKMDDLKILIEKLKSIQDQLILSENSNKELKDTLRIERRENEDLKQKLSCFERENITLKSLVEGKENQNSSIVQKNLSQEKEIFDLKAQIQRLIRELEDKTRIDVDFSEDCRLLVEIISKDLEQALKYADTYIGSLYFNEKLLIPELQSNCFIVNTFRNEIFNEYLKKLNLPSMFAVFSKLQKKIYDEMTFYEQTYANVNKENNEFLEKETAYNNEISSLNKTIEEQSDKINILISNLNSVKDDLHDLEEQNKQLKEDRDKKSKAAIISFEEVEEEIIFILTNLDNTKNQFLTVDFNEESLKNFIDFDDLKEIFKLNYVNHNNLFHGKYKESLNVEQIINKSEITKFDLGKFKENMQCFFSVFKSLAEEYSKTVKKVIEMSNIRKEVEIIRNEFNKSKQIMLIENEDLVRKNKELKNQLEIVFTENITNLTNEFKEKERRWREEISRKSAEFYELSQENCFLRNQIESQERRIRILVEGKSESEKRMKNLVDEKSLFLSDAENNLNSLILENQALIFKIKDLESINDKLERTLKIINSDRDKNKSFDKTLK